MIFKDFLLYLFFIVNIRKDIHRFSEWECLWKWISHDHVLSFEYGSQCCFDGAVCCHFFVLWFFFTVERKRFVTSQFFSLSSLSVCYCRIKFQEWSLSIREMGRFGNDDIRVPCILLFLHVFLYYNLIWIKFILFFDLIKSYHDHIRRNFRIDRLFNVFNIS